MKTHENRATIQGKRHRKITVGGWLSSYLKGGKNPIRKEGVLMDIGIFVGIIGLCISCFSLGMQFGKDYGNKNDRPTPKVTVILTIIKS